VFRARSSKRRKAATNLKPDHAQAYLFCGVIAQELWATERGHRAVARFKGCGDSARGFEIHLVLGQALAPRGDRTGAETSLTTAQNAQPATRDPLRKLAKLKDAHGGLRHPRERGFRVGCDVEAEVAVTEAREQVAGLSRCSRVPAREQRESNANLIHRRVSAIDVSAA